MEEQQRYKIQKVFVTDKFDDSKEAAEISFYKGFFYREWKPLLTMQKEGWIEIGKAMGWK